MAIAATILSTVAGVIEALVPVVDPARGFKRVTKWPEWQQAPGTAGAHRHFILKWADGLDLDQSFEDCSPVLRFRKSLAMSMIYHVPNQEPAGDILGIVEDDFDQIANAIRQYRARTVISDTTGETISLKIGTDKGVEAVATGDYLILTTSIEVIYGRRF